MLLPLIFWLHVLGVGSLRICPSFSFGLRWNSLVQYSLASCAPAVANAVSGSLFSSGRGSLVAQGPTPVTALGIITVARDISNLAPGLNVRVSLSPATIASFYPLLQALIPQRDEKGFAETLERTLDISQPARGTATVPVESLWALAAFVASNNMLDRPGDDLLKWIVKSQHTEALARFMQIQTPTTCAFARALLGSAIRIRNYQMIDTILDGGIELGSKLYDIACLGNSELTQRVLLNARPGDLAGNNGGRLLHLFIRDRHLDLAKFLLDRGVPVDSQTGCAGSPLYKAVRESDHKGVAFLVAAGADINLQCCHCCIRTSGYVGTPLALALSSQKQCFCTQQLMTQRARGQRSPEVLPGRNAFAFPDPGRLR